MQDVSLHLIYMVENVVIGLYRSVTNSSFGFGQGGLKAQWST